MTEKTKKFSSIFLAMAFVMILLQLYIMPHIRVLAPSFFGLQRITQMIYVEPSMTIAQKWTTYKKVAQAERSIIDFFGSKQSNPKIIACHTSFCYSRFGGKNTSSTANATKKASDNIIRLVSNDINDRYLIRYKLAKQELFTRLGKHKNTAVIPIWFQEGLATYLSGNPRFGKVAWYQYLRESPALKDIQKIKTPQNWKTAMAKNVPAQILARQEFARWYDETGQSGLLKLIEELNVGRPFKKAFAKQMQVTLK